MGLERCVAAVDHDQTLMSINGMDEFSRTVDSYICCLLHKYLRVSFYSQRELGRAACRGSLAGLYRNQSHS